jgi:hypothetical protein
MDIFGSSVDCCFVEAKLRKGVKGVRVSFGSEGDSAFGDETVITAVGFNQREKFSVLPCFNNKNYLYAFGHDAASSTAEVTAITSVCPDGTGLSKLAKIYKESRASVDGGLATITYGKLAIRGVLVGMTSGTVDARLNLQNVTFSLVLLKPIGD